MIPTEQLPQLVLQLPPPMGVMGDRKGLRAALRQCMKLKLKQHNGEVRFEEVRCRNHIALDDHAALHAALHSNSMPTVCQRSS